MTSDRVEMLKRWHTGRTGANPSFDRLSPMDQKRVMAKAGLLHRAADRCPDCGSERRVKPA